LPAETFGPSLPSRDSLADDLFDLDGRGGHHHANQQGREPEHGDYALGPLRDEFPTRGDHHEAQDRETDRCGVGAWLLLGLPDLI
jgi:hypothetical protein